MTGGSNEPLRVIRASSGPDRRPSRRCRPSERVVRGPVEPPSEREVAALEVADRRDQLGQRGRARQVPRLVRLGR